MPSIKLRHISEDLLCIKDNYDDNDDDDDDDDDDDADDDGDDDDAAVDKVD